MTTEGFLTAMESNARGEAMKLGKRQYLNRSQIRGGDTLWIGDYKGNPCCGWADPDGTYTREVQGFSLAVARQEEKS